MALFDIFKKKTEQALKRTKEAWFGKIAGLFERQTIEKGLWDELEELLIAADAGVETTEKLIRRVKERVDKQRVNDAQQVRTILMEEMTSVLQVNGSKPLPPASPRIVLVVGVNGSGKTTSIAKLGHLYKRDGGKVILAAADTFRAAAIDQLKWWGAVSYTHLTLPTSSEPCRS
ncbi:MAG: signal recognition particle receptor subunit alpha, partial [Dehalococcoidia bacterium]|nr:signal recognition particle receptor subunit alpha [Dehalococcoidia bacterium]